MGFAGVGCPEEQGVQWDSCAQGPCWTAESCIGTAHVCARTCRCQLVVRGGAVRVLGQLRGVCSGCWAFSLNRQVHTGPCVGVGHRLPAPGRDPSRLCQEHPASVPSRAERGHTRAPLPVPVQTLRTTRASPGTTPKPKPHPNPEPNLKPNPDTMSVCARGAETTRLR